MNDLEVIVFLGALWIMWTVGTLTGRKWAKEARK